MHRFVPASFLKAFLFGFFLAMSAILAQADNRTVRMPTIQNPYCAVATEIRPDVPEQARAMKGLDGKPVIHLNSSIIEDRDYANFLMAHECCHHTLDHIDTLRAQMARRGEVEFKKLAAMVKDMELKADCCAAKLLKKRGEFESLDAAKRAMTKFGGMPTGAYYPSGMERAFTIADCAEE